MGIAFLIGVFMTRFEYRILRGWLTELKKLINFSEHFLKFI